MRSGGHPAIADVGAAALVCEFVGLALREVNLAGVTIGQGRVIGTVGSIVLGGRQYLYLPGRGTGTGWFAADNAAAASELMLLPSNLVEGIEPSDDPLIDARVNAYAVSFSRRSQ